MSLPFGGKAKNQKPIYPKACIYKSEYLPLTVSTRMSRVIDSVQKNATLTVLWALWLFYIFSFVLAYVLVQYKGVFL